MPMKIDLTKQTPEKCYFGVSEGMMSLVDKFVNNASNFLTNEQVPFIIKHINSGDRSTRILFHFDSGEAWLFECDGVIATFHRVQ